MCPYLIATPKSTVNKYETRSEKRLNLSMPLFIRNAADSSSLKQAVATENVSGDGVRIICNQFFEAGTFLEVSGLAGRFAALAEVRYFESNWNGTWSIGLNFIIKNGSWIVD